MNPYVLITVLGSTVINMWSILFHLSFHLPLLKYFNAHSNYYFLSMKASHKSSVLLKYISVPLLHH